MVRMQPLDLPPQTHFGYKTCLADDCKPVIVQLEISDKEHNEMRTGVKLKNRDYAWFRCKRAVVTRIYRRDDPTKFTRAFSFPDTMYTGELDYILKQEVVSPEFDEDKDVVDGAGIHYFLSEEAAYWYGIGPRELTFKEYYDNGQLHFDVRREIFKEGKSEEYYKSGELKGIYTHKGSGCHGKCITYYKNGHLETIIHYEDNETHGPYEQYYENGQLKLKCNYYYRDENGDYNSYYESGQPKIIGRYEYGIRVGEWLFYHESGILQMKRIYTRGQLVYQTSIKMDVD